MTELASRFMEDSAYVSTDESYDGSYEQYLQHFSSKMDHCKYSKSYTSSTSSDSSDESTILGPPTKKHVEVYCPNMHLGCQWSGSLENITVHTTGNCAYTEVVCSSCHRSLPRKMMEDHVKSDCLVMPCSRDSKEVSAMPVLVMMQGFEERKMTGERWCSPVLLTHKNGYQLQTKD